MSGYAKRLPGIVVGAAIVCVLLGLYIGLYLTSQPGSASAAQSPSGRASLPRHRPRGRAHRPASDLGLLLRGQRPEPATGATTPPSCCRPTRWCTSRSTTTTGRPGCATRSSRRPQGTAGGSFTARRQADAGDRPRHRVARVRDPSDRALGAARRRPRQRQEPVRQRAVLAQHRPHARPRSPSARAARGCTAGSASSPAPPDSSPGGAGRCRRSATWTASSRSYEGRGTMSEVNHWRRFVLWWLGTSVIATLLVVLLLAPILPPGQRLGRGLGAGGRQHRPARHLDAGRDGRARLLHLRDDRLPRARARGGPRRPADPRRRQGPDVVAGGHHRDRPVPGRLRHGPAAGRRRRRRPGAEPDRRAGRRQERAAGAGDRPAVEVHLPLAGLRRRRDADAGAARQQDDRVPRHLAGRDPLVLGLPARRQGRRQPRRSTTSPTSPPRAR